MKLAHQPFTLDPGIAAEHTKLSVIGDQAEDRIEGCGLAGSVRADQSAPRLTIIFPMVEGMAPNAMRTPISCAR